MASLNHPATEQVIALADEAATEALGEKIARELKAGDFIALDGELGAGKTCFVRGLARGLGIDSHRVASPTYVTMQTYSGGRLPLIHIDVWRMKESNELETIGWDELLTDQSGVIVVEWAKKITGALPQKRIQIQIAFSNSKDNSTMSSSQDLRTATIVDHRVLPA